jgi:hypothetical protein
VSEHNFEVINFFSFSICSGDGTCPSPFLSRDFAGPVPMNLFLKFSPFLGLMAANQRDGQEISWSPGIIRNSPSQGRGCCRRAGVLQAGFPLETK